MARGRRFGVQQIVSNGAAASRSRCHILSRSRKQVWRRIGGTTDVHNTNYALVLRSPQSRGASSGLFLDMQAKRFGRSKLHPTLR